MTRRLFGTASVAVLAMLLGCTGTSVRSFSRPPTGQREYGKVKKVALLPFDSVVEGAEAPRIAGDLFLQELLTRGTFEEIEEPRYVAELMKKLKLRNTENLDREIVRKIGEELQSQAIILGNVLMFGLEDNSEIVEFSLQVTMLDVENGGILWSGRTYSRSSTTVGEILGVNLGPSVNAVTGAGVSRIVARFDREFRKAREAEVERMLEAARAEELTEGVAPPPEEGVPEKGVEAPPPEEEAEEILLEIKPK